MLNRNNLEIAKIPKKYLPMSIIILIMSLCVVFLFSTKFCFSDIYKVTINSPSENILIHDTIFIKEESIVNNLTKLQIKTLKISAVSSNTISLGHVKLLNYGDGSSKSIRLILSKAQQKKLQDMININNPHVPVTIILKTEYISLANRILRSFN